MLDGLMLIRIERMSLDGFCRYRSEGPGMAGNKNVEDYPDLPLTHAQARRVRLAEELGVLEHEDDGG
jgi:hypothetical protein